jgi:tripeptide aminopeptidase
LSAPADRLIERFFEFVRIDSESGDEKAFLVHLAQVLQEVLGADCRQDSYGNLIARIPAKQIPKEAPPLLFACHADTVKPGKGIEPVVIDGAIRSQGSTILGADDKAGIAQLIEALLTASQHPPIEFVVSREEEIGLVGARNLDTSVLQAREGFVLDMDSLDAVVVGGPTHVLLDVAIYGKAAHAAMEPEKGVSAIEAAACAICKMSLGRLDEETTANVGIIEGGQIRNGIPEKVELKAECRSLNHERCLQIAGEMTEHFEAAAQEVGATATVNREVAYKASSVSEDARVVRWAQEAITDAGLTPNVQTICGGTDASIYNERGIETVVIGTGVKAEHSTDEHVLLSDMQLAVRIIRHIVERAH